MMKLALPLLFALAGCAQGPTPEARYLSAGTQPVCLVWCFVTVHNAEAGNYPNLRTVSDLGTLSKTSTQTSTTSAQ